jgi:hypothetical protein
MLIDWNLTATRVVHHSSHLSKQTDSVIFWSRLQIMVVQFLLVRFLGETNCSADIIKRLLIHESLTS